MQPRRVTQPDEKAFRAEEARDCLAPRLLPRLVQELLPVPLQLLHRRLHGLDVFQIELDRGMWLRRAPLIAR